LQVQWYRETAEIVVARIIGTLYRSCHVPLLALETRENAAKLGVTDIPLGQIGCEVEKCSPGLANIRDAQSREQVPVRQIFRREREGHPQDRGGYSFVGEQLVEWDALAVVRNLRPADGDRMPQELGLLDINEADIGDIIFP